MLDFGFYNLDCMDGMKEFPDKYFDLAIVDPPYGISATKFNNGANAPSRKGAELPISVRLNTGSGKLKNRILNNSNCEWDKYPPDKEYFAELFRVSKNQIIWGGNYFDLPLTRGIIAWDKMQPWENFSQFEYAWTSFDKPAKIFRYCTTQSKNKIHPTQKPIDLYLWLLNTYANKDAIILDTHVGSASSLIACYRTNHKFVGFEIDKYYYEKANERLNLEKRQRRLF